ncbi:hypothetical protein [Saccharopolyspora gregorii]|uniref:Uncharacterized protein n=1 Tax=Saccharopolyspora gregorii TaxID=33914 RepID=A0ABP6RH49_9PSEU
MSDLRSEIETPTRILIGIGGLDQRMVDSGWDGLFEGLIQNTGDAHRRLAAAIEDIAS